MVTLIEAYEAKHYPIDSPDPVDDFSRIGVLRLRDRESKTWLSLTWGRYATVDLQSHELGDDSVVVLFLVMVLIRHKPGGSIDSLNGWMAADAGLQDALPIFGVSLIEA